MFSRHAQDQVKTWRDFYFDLKTYFDGWLKESKVTTLEELKNLIVADQIKKKAPQDYKYHFLDQWCNWNKPLQLVDKLDSYEEVRNMRKKNFSWKQKEMKSNPWRRNNTRNPKLLSHEHSLSSFLSQSRRETGVPNNSRRNPTSNDRIPEKKIVDTKEDRTPVPCYGCGAPGIIRSRCHTCSPVRQKDTLSSSLNQSNFYSFSSENNPSSIIQISICNTEAAVCADTGATHSVAGEKFYNLLKQKGLNFEVKTMQMTLDDGRTQTTEILTTSVDIGIQGKVIATELIILKNAKGNRTLLGIDFLTAAGIVLDLQRKQWYFTETSHRKYSFVKAPPNINALLTVDTEPHPCQLRENDRTYLSLTQRKEINSLLEKYEECFQPGGEHTPIIEHRINTRDHLPVAVLPYRMNPSKKEKLKREIDRLLAEGIIEECESPYASPVLIIPKPNGTFRLCIDYRKLNEIIVADTYPLPRMDDLLHQAKLTPFMSTLDLRAGYHQVKVHVEDQDKTAFVCPFGTYRYLRMPNDASNYALGAVLLQGEGSDEHPIEYASRLLTPAERNYSTTEREALAVFWALKKFHGYIEGTEKTVASDHKPLKWLLNLKSPTGRLARWALEIQSYNLKLHYTPGKANVVADMLSRLVTQEEESFCEANNITIADMPTRSCVLYRYVPDADSAEAQLVIPNA
ncbi:retrovirus-related Pol polyprotein from transposon 297 [Trichonephila clavipes]|nr:retrovirus-related Pol polyprotein from transposon 297 [Trichonephila clavipes]